MSFVTALPAMLASAAGELHSIGSAVAAGNTAPLPKYPQVPDGFPTNGHAPPGYETAVKNLLTNGHVR